jgi:hypothetical protein
MFVRWKRRLRRPKTTALRHYPAEYSLYAVLVESERQHGKPRQRFIAHLASIREGYLDTPTHQSAFWRDAQAALDALDLTAGVRELLEAALALRVPCPTDEEVAALQAEAAWALARIESRLGIRTSLPVDFKPAVGGKPPDWTPREGT